MGARYLVFISTFSKYEVLAVLAAAVVSLTHPTCLFAKIEFSVTNVVVENASVTSILSVSGLTAASCPSGRCYLQGVVQQADKKPYFGSTLNNIGSAVPYEPKPKDNNKFGEMFSFTPQNGAWGGELTIIIDPYVTGYYGPGAYTFKVLRYTGNSNAASAETSDVPIQLSLPVPTPTVEPTPTLTPAKMASPTAKSVATTIVALAKTSTPTPIPTGNTLPTMLVVDQVLSDQDNLIDTDTDSIHTPDQFTIGEVAGQPSDLVSPIPNQSSVVGYVLAGATVVAGCVLIGLSLLPFFVKIIT